MYRKLKRTWSNGYVNNWLNNTNNWVIFIQVFFISVIVLSVVGFLFNMSLKDENEKISTNLTLFISIFFSLLIASMITSVNKIDKKTQLFWKKAKEVRDELEAADSIKKIYEIWGGSYYELVKLNISNVHQSYEIKCIRSLLELKFKMIKQRFNKNEVVELMWVAYKAADSIFEDEISLRLQFDELIKTIDVLKRID